MAADLYLYTLRRLTDAAEIERFTHRRSSVPLALWEKLCGEWLPLGESGSDHLEDIRWRTHDAPFLDAELERFILDNACGGALYRAAERAEIAAWLDQHMGERVCAVWV